MEMAGPWFSGDVDEPGRVRAVSSSQNDESVVEGTPSE